MKRLWHTYASVIGPNRFLGAFLLALSVKGVLFIGLLQRFRNAMFPGYWGGFTFDSASYIDPVEHLLANGAYLPDYRMPGFAVPYWCLRQLFDKAQALNAYLLLQLLMGALSVVLLARIAFHITRAVAAFHVVFWLFAISTFVSLYDVLPLTESLTSSVIIIAVYLLLRGTSSGKAWHLAAAGLFFTWAAFLRPVMLPLLVFGMLAVLLRSAPWRWERRRAALAFLLPFLLIETAWILRNHAVHERVVPLSTSWMMPDFLGSPTYRMCEVVQAFGGSLVWWDPQAEIRAFNIKDVGEAEHLRSPAHPPVIPAYAATPGFPMDSLQALARTVERWNMAASDPALRASEGRRILETGALYIATYKAEKPFQYYMVAPLRILGKFTLHNGTYLDLPNPRNAVERMATWFFALLYWLSIFGGALAAVVAVFNPTWNRSKLLIPVIFGYGLLVHPLILRFCEYRYLVPFYPWGLLLAVWLIHMLWMRRIRTQSSSPLASSR